MASPTTTFEEFEAIEVQGEEASIFLRHLGSGPPVLLLHCFPQTHLMWRSVAPLLARSFTVVCADLRGYGRSSCPPSRPDHAPYAKRAMASDMVLVMEKLGFSRFSIVGHDRAVASPIVSRSITRSAWNVSPFLILPLLLTRGSGPTRSWLQAIGRGHCLRNLSLSPSGSYQLLPMPSLMTR
jgi:hypothetical protein